MAALPCRSFSLLPPCQQQHQQSRRRAAFRQVVFTRWRAVVHALQQGPPPPPLPPPRRRRLVDTVLSTPRRVELYFEGSLLRKALWSAIAYGGGFYAGNVVTLSFGALAINDVLAAALTVVFYEVVTNAFYEAEVKTLRLWFANFFKVGVVTGLIADAVKLGG